MFARSLAFAASLSIAGVPAAASAEPLRPTAKWVVNFDDSQCIASRNYGTEQAPLLLGLKAPALGKVVQLMVVAPGGGGNDARQVRATVDAGTGPAFDTNMLTFAVDEHKQRVYRVNLPLEQFASVRSAKTLAIRGSGDIGFAFALDDMRPLMTVMDECVADLRQVWNVSNGDSPHPKLSQAAEVDLEGVFRGGDYPQLALDYGDSGSTRVVMLIDERGAVADCTVIETSGSASLDAQSCGILEQRARFAPAVGIDGQPAKSSYVQRISWRSE